MTDVNALFASRKKKKKGSKIKNFTNVLQAVESEPSQGYVSDGNEDDVDEEVVKKTTGKLTAAVNKTKKKKKADDALAAGDWVDEDELPVQAPKTILATKGKVVDMENLSSSIPEPDKSEEELHKEAENRKLFHWTRKQALDEAETPKEPEVQPKKTGIYRPRHLEMQKNAESGKAALGQLQNESVFPSLGGGGSTKSSPSVQKNSAWGTVKTEVIEEFQVKQPDGVFLGEEFYAAEDFEGAKPGYSFKKGRSGLGYYWEGPRDVIPKKEKEEEAEEEVATREVTEKETTTTPSSPTIANDSQKKEVDEEKERKRREKKKEKERQKLEWEKQNALAIERERAELKKKEEEKKAATSSTTTAATTATPVASEVEPPPASDRFAGLKKKKKKKKAPAK